MTPAGTYNELDVQNEWEENTHTYILESCRQTVNGDVSKEARYYCYFCKMKNTRLDYTCTLGNREPITQPLLINKYIHYQVLTFSTESYNTAVVISDRSPAQVVYS